MTSTSETGHAKNMANFQNLITFCTGYGSSYNPSKESLQIIQLQAQYQAAQEILDTLKNQKTAFDIATNERKTAFVDLKPLATKIINAFAVSGTDALAINNIKSINKKIQGSRSKKATPSDISTASTTASISTSQQSYDALMDHFGNLVQALQQYPAYRPNEEALKTETLQANLAAMQSKSKAVLTSYTAYSNAMIARDQALYNALTGIVQTAKEVKQYTKSLFGASSPQFKQISSVELVNIKSK